MLSAICGWFFYAARAIDGLLNEVQAKMLLFENQLNGVTGSVIQLNQSQEVFSKLSASLEEDLKRFTIDGK